MVFAYYQEALKPEFQEDITQGTKYLDGQVEFRAEIKDYNQYKIQHLTGIKEVQYDMVLKVKAEHIPLRFKAKDKVFVYGDEYDVVAVSQPEVPTAHKLKASRNSRLFDRYATQVVVLRRGE